MKDEIRTKIVITGEDLTELSDCDDAVQDLIQRDGLEQVAISFKLSYKDVYDTIQSHIGSWSGVTVKREEKDGVITLRLVWDKESRNRAAHGLQTLANPTSSVEKQPAPKLMPKK